MPQVASNIFQVDPVQFQSKIPSIAAHIAGVAVDVASCTPNPIDDMLAPSLAGPIASILQRLVTTPQPPVMMSAPMSEEVDADIVQELKSSAASHGKILTPEHLQILLNVIKTLLPLLPAVL